MKVQVKYYLAGICTVVHDQPKTLAVDAEYLSHSLDSIMNLRDHIGWCLDQVLEVLLRTNQQMSGRTWVMVVKNDYVVVLVEDVRWCFSVNYIAENTSHISSPTLKSPNFDIHSAPNKYRLLMGRGNSKAVAFHSLVQIVVDICGEKS